MYSVSGRDGEEIIVESWELDALDPKTITEVVNDTIRIYRDDKIFNQRKTVEKKERVKIEQIAQTL